MDSTAKRTFDEAIAAGDLSAAFGVLHAQLDSGSGPAAVKDEAVRCEGRLSALDRNVRNGTMPRNEEMVERELIKQQMQDLFRRCPVRTTGGTDNDPVPDLGPAPAVEPDELVVRRFVGRADEVNRVLAAVRRQKAGQKKRPRDVPALFWYHGFGGMGKSWLLRRLTYEASRPRRGKAPQPAVLLVDWNPGSARWNPLRASPADPTELFRGIATRATQVCGRGTFDRYWEKAGAFRRRAAEWTDLCTRLRQALAGLRPGADPERLVVEPGPDRFPVRFTTPEAGNDRAMLEQVLRGRHLWPAKDDDRADCLTRVGEPGPTWESVYEAWAEAVAPPGLPDREVVVRPYSVLADTLQSGLEGAARVRPLFLLLDTCEQLDEWADGWLRRLLVPLLTGPAAAVSVIGSRSRPDRYHTPGQQGGWRDELAGRISLIPFDRDRHFTVSEVADLLRRTEVSIPGIDLNDLAIGLHAITRGVPLGLGILLDEPSLLREVANLADLGGSEMDTGKASRRVIEEVAARFLQHVSDPRDRDDLFALALLPGGAGNDDPDWDLRPRARWGWPDGPIQEGYRVRVLKVLWGDPGWRPRLEALERRYALVADGDIHPTVRHYFRGQWRDAPPDGLAAVVDRLAAAVDSLRPADGVYDQDWVAWSALRVELDGWRGAKDVADRLARTAVLGQAHGLGIWELGRVLADLGDRAGGLKALTTWGDVPTLAKLSAGWSDFEKACLALLDGVTKAESVLPAVKGSANEAKLVEAVELLYRAIDSLWPGLTNARRREVSEVYLQGVSMLTTNGKRPRVLTGAVELAQRLQFPTTGVLWWGTLLHNQGLYEESCLALRGMMEAAPDEPGPPLVLVHNLGDHLGRTEEALAVVEQGLSRFEGDLRFVAYQGQFLGKLGRIDEGIEALRAALNDLKARSYFTPRGIRADCHCRLGRLYAAAGRLDDAEAELRRAVELEPAEYDTVRSLADVLDKQGKGAEAQTVFELALAAVPEDGSDWCNLANSASWRMYLSRTRLVEAEELAGRGLKANPDDLPMTHTLMAIQCRAGKWQVAEPHLRRYIREHDMDLVFGGGWYEHILFFRDAVAAERGDWVAEWIAQEQPEPRDDRWELVRFALTDPSTAPERLRPGAQAVYEQFRSSAPDLPFPRIPSAAEANSF